MQKGKEGAFVDILPHHVEALESFCREVILPAMKPCLSSHGIQHILNQDEELVSKRKLVMDKFKSRHIFEDFFEEYRKMKIEDGYGSWAEVKSPYKDNIQEAGIEN